MQAKGSCLPLGSPGTIGRPALPPGRPAAAVTGKGLHPPIPPQLQGTQRLPSASRPMAQAFQPKGPASPPLMGLVSPPVASAPPGPVSQPTVPVSQLTALAPASLPMGPAPMEPESELKALASQPMEQGSQPMGPAPMALVSQPMARASQQKVPVSQPTALAPVPLQERALPRQVLRWAESPPSSSQGPHQGVRLPAAVGGCRSSSAGRR